MTQDSDELWRAKPGMPNEAPDWINRDYSEQDEQPKSRRWMIITVVILSACFAFSGLYGALEPLWK